MGSSNATKARQLGMPWGTAMGRLRKSIMFKYVQLAGHDVCYRCGGSINAIDDLSIEHKEYWLHVDADLFWDLDNIAFSHLNCNLPHRTPGAVGIEPVNKVHCPDGTNWCGRCKAFLPVGDFSKNPTKRNGLNDYCRLCRSEYRRQLKHGEVG